MSPRSVGVVSLGEAGNLGDDLILVALVEAIASAGGTTEVRYLSHGEFLDWSSVGHLVGARCDIARVEAPRELPGSRRRSRLFASADLVFFGGGGLLQTSHGSMRPYEWLDYLPDSPSTPVHAVGLGLGPIHPRIVRGLREMTSPFSSLHVRDESSLRLAQDELGWRASLGQDLVTRAFLERLASPPAAGGSGRLGVALRAWPGLEASAVAQVIRARAQKQQCTHVQFFVLEAKSGKGPDVEFARAVAERLDDFAVSVHVYGGGDVASIVREMWNCSDAIAMKLHAAAVWAARNVPTVPIIYAPKVASFFGVDYRGLEVLEDVVHPSTATRGESAAKTVRGLLAESRTSPSATPRGRLKPSVRIEYQCRSSGRSLRLRASRLLPWRETG